MVGPRSPLFHPHVFRIAFSSHFGFRDRSCNITVFYGSENLCKLTVRFDKLHYILHGCNPFVGVQHQKDVVCYVGQTTLMVGQRLVMARHSSHRATTNLDGASNLAPKLRLNIQFGSRRGCHEPNDKNAPIQPFRIQTWNGRDQRTSIFQRCNRGNTAQQPICACACRRIAIKLGKFLILCMQNVASTSIQSHSTSWKIAREAS